MTARTVYVLILLFIATAVVVWLWIDFGPATALLFGGVGFIGALAAAARSGREERRYLRGSVDTRDAPRWQKPGLTPTVEDRDSRAESHAAEDVPRS